MRKTPFFLHIVTAAVILLSSGTVSGQYIKANVQTKLDKLHQDYQQELQNLDQEIKDYIESTKWTDNKYPFDEFTVTITISIDDFEAGFENLYKARFFIVSSTGYQESDKRWDFPYRVSQAMYYDPNIFDPLTGLIDFYIMLIIGEELDKYEQYGGTEIFRRAFTTAQLGKSHRYNRWWDKRAEIAQTYLQEWHKPFRNMTSWFYAAHYWTLEGEQEEARGAALETLNLLKKIQDNTFEREFRVKFYERNYKDLAVVFSQFDDMYQELMRLDPERKKFYVNFKKDK